MCDTTFLVLTTLTPEVIFRSLLHLAESMGMPLMAEAGTLWEDESAQLVKRELFLLSISQNAGSGTGDVSVARTKVHRLMA